MIFCFWCWTITHEISFSSKLRADLELIHFTSAFLLSYGFTFKRLCNGFCMLLKYELLLFHFLASFVNSGIKQKKCINSRHVINYRWYKSPAHKIYSHFIMAAFFECLNIVSYCSYVTYTYMDILGKESFTCHCFIRCTATTISTHTNKTIRGKTRDKVPETKSNSLFRRLVRS